MSNKDGKHDAISKLIAGLWQYITSSDDRWISNPDQHFRWPVIFAVDKKMGQLSKNERIIARKTSELSLTISDEFVSSRCNARYQWQSQEGSIHHEQILFVPLWNCQPTKWTLCEVWCLDKCVANSWKHICGYTTFFCLSRRSFLTYGIAPEHTPFLKTCNDIC